MERFTAVETARVVSHLPNFFRKAMTQLMQEELHQELSKLEQVDIDQVLPNPDPLKLNNVLVTGVTGALGIYIVRELLTHSKAEIYCLVRAGTPQEAKERIAANFACYNLACTEQEWTRLHPVIGDLHQEQFGLTMSDYGHLADVIDTIIHCAANTSFVVRYEVSYKTNVFGTGELLRFAIRQRIKAFHHVASCGARVLAYYEPGDKDLGLFTGYSQSKYVSEKMVHFMLERGLPGTIYEIGYLSLDYDRFNPTDSFESFLQLCIELKLVPEIDADFDYTPIASVAREMVQTAQQQNFQQHKLNLHHAFPLPWSAIVASVCAVKPDVKPMPFLEFFPIFQEFMRLYRAKRIYAMKKVISKDFPLQLNAMFRGVPSDFSPANSPQKYDFERLTSILSHVQHTYEWQ